MLPLWITESEIGCPHGLLRIKKKNVLNMYLAGSIFSVGEALLFFLEALPEPVSPYKYHAKCLEACNNYVLCKQVRKYF